MMALSTAILLAAQYSPAPPPAPRKVVAPGYLARCTAIADADKREFPITLQVKQRGSARQVKFTSGAPDIVPSTKSISQGVNDYGTRAEDGPIRETFTSGAEAYLVHRWAIGAATSRLEIVYFVMNKPIRTLANAKCTIEWSTP